MSSTAIPSAANCLISSLVSTDMGPPAAGVGGIVVRRCRTGGSVDGGGERECFRIGHETEVDVWPWAALGLPWAMHKKQDGGQSQPRPLCLVLAWGQLKWWRASLWAPPHLLHTTRSLWRRQRSTVWPSRRQRVHWDRRGRASQLRMETNFPNIPTRERLINSRPSPVGSWNAKVTDDASFPDSRSFSGLNSHRGAARGRRPTNTGFRHSSSYSILGDARLPRASFWRRTPLISIDW